MTMKSTKPYLFRAMYQWIVDSQCTPLVLARTDILGAVVPEGYAKDGQIMLDIAQDSVKDFLVDDHVLSFKAVFGDDVCQVRFPMVAILAIYAAENGKGLEFGPEEDENSGDQDQSGSPELRVL
ncbi:stringent starvation protein B [Candidatus Synchoanobacter obligatus]|uniref:ClpXP protease specificity-enhancing factor SspB n=1 Tax=Candidatus Synchoanobacter obligatus TaxID=2919597 RepID=A0ABT1L5H1_9GAMM|nr:ClpXP protease specificity-enhancing factor SspB [Candidatus Synchoanobacter obligatus]MCP8352430.1 ClpXP protease specificity-enhancing factor SspB [Candidatus Synchoanobacter obligatus]